MPNEKDLLKDADVILEDCLRGMTLAEEPPNLPERVTQWIEAYKNHLKERQLDIVQRLRSAKFNSNLAATLKTCEDAADEIEKLRKQIGASHNA